LLNLPWPLDGANQFFEDLWNWIGQAAVEAVKRVSDWLKEAVSGLWDEILGGLVKLKDSISDLLDEILRNFISWSSAYWVFLVQGLNATLGGIASAVLDFPNVISRGLSGIWTSISGAFSGLTTRITQGLGGLLTNLVGVVTSFANGITLSIMGLGNALTTRLSGLWTDITGGLSGLWTNFTAFMAKFGSDVFTGLNNLPGLFLTAIVDAVNALLPMLGGELRSKSPALWYYHPQPLGTLSLVSGWIHDGITNAFDWIVKAFGNVAATIGGFLKDKILTPLGDALQGLVAWISSSVVGFLQNALQFFGSPSSPDIENPLGSIAQVLTGVLGFTVSMAVPLIAGELVHPLKELGLGQVSAMLYDMAGFGRIASALTLELATISYIIPLRYGLNYLWRPSIPSTGMADQMLFEDHITEPRWRQIYAYHGWKDADIDAWYKTMFREPSQIVLRSMSSDADTDPEWLQKKYRELGFIGDDLEAMIDYGRRQAVRDERTALATQVQTDFIDGVIIEADARSDLAALKFSPSEIDYRILKSQMIMARNARRAALKAEKNLTESDLRSEVSLGLRTHDQFIADMITIGYSREIAERKYALIITPRPLTAAEIERRKTVAQDKIVKAKRRYELLLTRLDHQAGLISDEIQATQTALAESLDVIDVDVQAISDELAARPSELVREPILRKIAATNRRYEAALASVDRRAALLAMDVEDTKTLMSATLDVIDVEIAAVEAELTELGVVP